MNEREYLRDLAKRLAEHGYKSEQQEKIQIIKNCNNLKPDRPVVYARPENGWNDLLDKWAPSNCKDPGLKKIEQNLQMQLIRAEHIKDDMPVLPEYPVPMRIRNNTYNDFGLLLEVEQTDKKKGAYHIKPAISDWANMDRLHFRNLLIDREGSKKDLEFTQELFGDILDVYQTGIRDWRYGIFRILIHMRGFQTFLMDMYDFPDELHRLAKFLKDNFQNEIEFYTKEKIIRAPLKNRF